MFFWRACFSVMSLEAFLQLKGIPIADSRCGNSGNVRLSCSKDVLLSRSAGWVTAMKERETKMDNLFLNIFVNETIISASLAR